MKDIDKSKQEFYAYLQGNKIKYKRPIQSYKRCWRTFDRQVFTHNTRKNALKSLLHIHEVISRFNRVFLQYFHLCKSFHTENVCVKNEVL